MNAPITPQPPFKLNAADVQGETWPKLKRHIEARIETLRNQLEGELDESKTANHRGRIAELRALLLAGKDT